MLGYTELVSNDLYVFFEQGEIEKLGKQKINGIYFNIRNPSKIGLLEASVNDSLDSPIKTSANKNEELFFTWLNLEIRLRQYNLLKETQTAGIHEGFRHIELLDASDINKLNVNNYFNYSQLKFYKSQVTNQNIPFLPR